MDVLHTHHEKFVVRFATDELSMPFSNTCFNTLTLPVIYSNYHEFKEQMDIALKYGYKDSRQSNVLKHDDIFQARLICAKLPIMLQTV